MFWNESTAAEGAASDRGWLWQTEADRDDPSVSALGTYLDYGPNHYRSGDREGTCWCRIDAPAHVETHERCRLHRPGNVLAVCYATKESTYAETPAAARAWVEGQVSR